MNAAAASRKPKLKAKAKAKGRAPTRSSEEKLAGVVPITEGQRLLLALSDSHADLAEKLGTARQSVHQWRSGSINPKSTMRQRLAEVLQIPAESWDRAAGTDAPALAPIPPSPPLGTDEVAELEALIGRVVAKREGLTSANELESIKLELNLRERRARAIERMEMQEPRYIAQHPTWQKIRVGLLKALKPHPAALRDVVSLLEALEV